MSNKPTLLERQFTQAAQMVKGAIEVYPILADDTAPMFQLAVAVIREEMDYKRQRAMERREDAGSGRDGINPVGLRMPFITTAIVDRLVSRAKVAIEGED